MGGQRGLVLRRRIDVAEQFRGGEFDSLGCGWAVLDDGADALGGFGYGEELRVEGAADGNGVSAFAVAGGDGNQRGGVIEVGEEHLADDGGAAGLVDVEQQDGAGREVGRVGDSAEACFDGGSFALGVVGVDDTADAAGLVNIAVGADAGLQLVGSVSEDYDDFIGAGLAQGGYLVDDEGAAVPVEEGFEGSHAPGYAGGEEDGGGVLGMVDRRVGMGRGSRGRFRRLAGRGVGPGRWGLPRGGCRGAPLG